jgi:hypothetical protein
MFRSLVDQSLLPNEGFHEGQWQEMRAPEDPHAPESHYWSRLEQEDPIKRRQRRYR